VKRKHVVDAQYLQNLNTNITTTDIAENMAELENTVNILDEIKSVLLVEEKRRRVQSHLNEKLEKGCVKKSRIETRQKRLEKKEQIRTLAFVGHSVTGGLYQVVKNWKSLVTR